jgi:DNA-binding transcriptional LysR family regulator
MIDEISGDFLQWLRGFYFVAKEGGIQNAVVAMGRARSTISRQIRCLENELGLTLFDRSTGKMLITPEGEKLLEDAVTLFENVNQIKGEFKNEGMEFQGKISIAATPGIISNILPPYITHFWRLHPKVIFQLEAPVRELIYEKVEAAEVDFGISSSEVHYKSLMCHDLYEAGMILIAPKNNPYFPGKSIPTIKQIAQAPLILFSHSVLQETRIKEQFFKNQLQPNVIMIQHNIISLRNYVNQGMGVAILAEHAMSEEERENFDIYSLDHYYPRRKYGILLKRKKYLPARVKAFLRTIKPDIDFSAYLKPAERSPVLSLSEFLHRKVCLIQKELPTVKAGIKINR